MGGFQNFPLSFFFVWKMDDDFSWYNGTVWVTIDEGKGLLAADSGGTSDPYVVVSTGPNGPNVGGDVKKAGKFPATRVVKKTLDPEWGLEQFELSVTHETEVILTVMDKDSFTSDDLLGVVKIPIRTLLHGEKRHEWVALDTQGHLKVAVWFAPTVDMEAAVVGVDLPTLLHRSSPVTEPPIPEIVVKLASIAKESGAELRGFGSGDAKTVALFREKIEGGHEFDTVLAQVPLGGAEAYDLLGQIFGGLREPIVAHTFYSYAIGITDERKDTVLRFLEENMDAPEKYIVEYMGKFLAQLAADTNVGVDALAGPWSSVLLWPKDWIKGHPDGMPDAEGRHAFVRAFIAHAIGNLF